MWKAKYRCTQCKTFISWVTKMDSRGVCPHCGNTRGSTIVPVETVACREKVTWSWKFPFRHVELEFRDSNSLMDEYETK